MKSLFISFNFFFLAVFTLVAQGNIPQPTHIVVREAISPAEPLENSQETFLYYDSNDFSFESKSNSWVSGDWVLDLRSYYTRDAQGKLTEMLEKAWDPINSVLINYSLTTIEYHPNGQENYRKQASWNPTTAQWENQLIATNTFTTSGKVEQYTREVFANGVVVAGARNIYSYDALNRLSQKIGQSWVNGAWINYQKWDYEYTGAAEDFAYFSMSLWDQNMATWMDPAIRQTQTITSDQSTLLGAYWDGSAWHPDSKYTTFYDANGLATQLTSEFWVDATASWKLNNKSERTYNSDFSSAQNTFYFTDFDSGVLFLQAVVDFDYQTYLAAEKKPASLPQVRVAPNPTTDFVQVQLGGELLSNLTLFDMQGKIVAQTSTTASEASLPISTQPAGTYLLRIEQGSATRTLQVVKF